MTETTIDYEYVPDDIIPGMREQGKGLKFYVESEYAPLKACTVGNPSGIFIPDPDTPENRNLFGAAGEEFNAFLRENKHKNLGDATFKSLIIIQKVT